jgi:ribosomal protein S18 acetylase RimI-like enzyme
MSRPNDDDEGEAPKSTGSSPALVPGLRTRVSGCRPVGEWRVTRRARLGGEDRSNVDQLRHECEAAEPLDLKVEFDEADHLDRPIHFLAADGSRLIGYAGLTPGDEAEACGMVHPSWRRRGVGTALLGEVRDAARSLAQDSILVICEDAGPAALVWMRRLGATLESAERRMVVQLTTPAGGPEISETNLEVRRASDADHDEVVALLGEEFSDQAHERRLVGIEGAAIVGTLRLTDGPRRTMIYGFVIDERRRGQRLGTRMLAAVIAQLRAEGVGEVGLEVNPDNTPAVRLYERFGFETVTTYRYMRLSVIAPEPRNRS